jgi:hypothetical protein
MGADLRADDGGDQPRA